MYLGRGATSHEIHVRDYLLVGIMGLGTCPLRLLRRSLPAAERTATDGQLHLSGLIDVIGRGFS